MKRPGQCEQKLQIDVSSGYVGSSNIQTRDNEFIPLIRKFYPLYVAGHATNEFFASFGQQHRPTIKFCSQETESKVEHGVQLPFSDLMEQPLNTLTTEARLYIDKLGDIRESATERAVAFLRAYESQLEVLLNSCSLNIASAAQDALDTSGIQPATQEDAVFMDINKYTSLSAAILSMRTVLAMLTSIVSSFYPSIPASIQFVIQSITEHCDFLEIQCGLAYKDNNSVMDTDTNTNTTSFTPPAFQSYLSSMAIGAQSSLDPNQKIGFNTIDQMTHTPMTPSSRVSAVGMAHTLCSKPRVIVKADDGWSNPYERVSKLNRVTSIPNSLLADKGTIEHGLGYFYLFNEPIDSVIEPVNKEKTYSIQQNPATATLTSPVLSKGLFSAEDISKGVLQDLSQTEAISESAENTELIVRDGSKDPCGEKNPNAVTTSTTNTNSILLDDASSEHKSTSEVLSLTKIRSMPGLLAIQPGKQMLSGSLVASAGEDLSDNPDFGDEKSNRTVPKNKAVDTRPGISMISSPDGAKYLLDDTLPRISSRGSAFTSESGVLSDMLTFLKALYNDRMVKAANDIYVELSRRVIPSDCVLIFGRSKLVLKALLLTHERLQVETGRSACFEVICIDAPESQCGLSILKKLSQAGIPCFYGLLTSLPLFIKHVTKVMMGAFSLSLDGSIQGRAGASLLANIAKMYKLPVIVACETYKVTDQFYMSALFHNVLRDTGMTSSKQKVQIIKPLYDTVGTNLISCIVTEYGAISPDSLREQLK